MISYKFKLKVHDLSNEKNVSRSNYWKVAEWRVSKNENYFLNYENHHLLIYEDKLYPLKMVG
jgi:hypothetical protein